jgi:hypothetical protein
VTGKHKFEVSILAFDKVLNRLTNGKEDDISFYFKGFEEKVEAKQTGLIYKNYLWLHPLACELVVHQLQFYFKSNLYFSNSPFNPG